MDNLNALSFHVNSVACQMLKSNLNGYYLAFSFKCCLHRKQSNDLNLRSWNSMHCIYSVISVTGQRSQDQSTF